MRTRFVEAAQTESGPNWGKFLVGLLEPEEWSRPSVVSCYPIMAGRGWSRHGVLVLDLQTGEGAVFHPGGSARADLEKHKIWVCPMFEPFLCWLYDHIEQVMETWFNDLPLLVLLPDAEFSMQGYRRGRDQ